MKYAYLGLGSNQGDRLAYLQSAVQQISEHAAIFAISSVYETEPVGMAEGTSWFLNMALGIASDMQPAKLVQTMQNIEAALGRMPGTHLLPRPIDIDVLLIEGVVVAEPGVTIPHVALANRRFALMPLAEIAGSVEHPVLRQTIAELLDICGDHSTVRRSPHTITVHHHSTR